MGTPATRMPDICTGHGCFPPRPSCSGSPNVFANSLPAKRMLDCFIPHGCPSCPPHMTLQAIGCTTVYCNSLMWSGILHPLICGGVNLTGSPNVYVCIVYDD